MNPFQDIPAPEYQLEQMVWVKMSLNHYHAFDYEGHNVFECKVIDIKLEASVSSESESPVVEYKYECELVSSWNDSITPKADDIFSTEAEACTASINEIESIITKRNNRTHLYQDVLGKLKSKVSVQRRFKIEHLYVKSEPIEFNEDTAPDCLKYGGREGSTMDNRWFWNDHVMKLGIGGSVDTDFYRITRLS